MPEEIDFSQAIENLKEMLSSDEGESQIQNILGMLASSGEGQTEKPKTAQEESSGSNIFSGISDVGDILKIKNLLASAGKEKDDSGALFLHSLKPFLSENRQAKLENAAKILSMTKAFKLLKDLGLGGV